MCSLTRKGEHSGRAAVTICSFSARLHFFLSNAHIHIIPHILTVNRQQPKKMSREPPFQRRPNLHLALTPLTGSPRQYSTSTPTSRAETPVPTPTSTPLATTSYSPFTSAGLKPLGANSFPTAQPYGSATPFKSRPRELRLYSRYNWLQMRRIFRSKPIWLALMGFALMLWWFNGGSHDLDALKLSASELGKELMQGRRMQDYQFYPASNPKIHVSSLK